MCEGKINRQKAENGGFVKKIRPVDSCRSVRPQAETEMTYSLRDEI